MTRLLDPLAGGPAPGAKRDRANAAAAPRDGVAAAPFALLLAAALAAPAAMAGRPLATDDAAIVEPGACQLESWLERQPSERRFWLNPACNPFGRIELSFGGARVRTDAAGATASTTVTAWQLKPLLREVDDDTPGFALALRDERDRRVHAGTLGNTSLTGIASVPLAGQALLAHLNLGVLRQRGDEARWRTPWAAALDGALGATTRVAIEAFGPGSGGTRWQLNLRHEWLPGRLQVDASVGSRFGGRVEERLFTVGLVVVSPPFLR